MIKTFICAKGTSVRCPNKNLKLIQYTLDKVKSFLDITVITDSPRIVEICKQNNVDYYIEDSNKQFGELMSIYNYLIETNQLESISDFIQLPLPQPFTNIETIMNVAYADLTEYDIATTYTIVPNRAIFLLNEDNSFKVDSYERKGCLCPDTKMIDGCIYKIKSSFLKEAINAESFNNHFWNKSKICFIENTSDIFIDIDTPKELKQFELLKNVINI